MSIESLPVSGSRVLVRVDFNVPMKDGRVADDTRIRAALPTLRALLERGPKALILMSHLGRPKGQVVPDLSLKPVAAVLAELLGQPVQFLDDCVGQEVSNACAQASGGKVILLENLRFHPAETKPELDASFAQQLASLGDCYVNDAFGTAHRCHASTWSVPQLLPGKAAMGLLMEREVNVLQTLLEQPERPFYAIIGGSKVSSKIGVLQSLVERVDGLLIGGAMAFTFWKLQGRAVGSSLVEEESMEVARAVLQRASERGIPVWLPLDVLAAASLDAADSQGPFTLEQGVPDGLMGLDIGPKTIEFLRQQLSSAATILWNGPVGVFENPAFAGGTLTIAQILAASSAVTVVGGGDSVAALKMSGLADQVTHLSTGGGATLELLEKGSLPAVDVITNNSDKIGII